VRYCLLFACFAVFAEQEFLGFKEESYFGNFQAQLDSILLHKMVGKPYELNVEEEANLVPLFLGSKEFFSIFSTSDDVP